MEKPVKVDKKTQQFTDELNELFKPYVEFVSSGANSSVSLEVTEP